MKYEIRVEHDSDEHVLLKLYLNETEHPLLYEATWHRRECCLSVNGEFRAKYITNEKDAKRALITQYERMLNKEDRSARDEILEIVK